MARGRLREGLSSGGRTCRPGEVCEGITEGYDGRRNLSSKIVRTLAAVPTTQPDWPAKSRHQPHCACLAPGLPGNGLDRPHPAAPSANATGLPRARAPALALKPGSVPLHVRQGRHSREISSAWDALFFQTTKTRSHAFGGVLDQNRPAGGGQTWCGRGGLDGAAGGAGARGAGGATRSRAGRKNRMLGFKDEQGRWDTHSPLQAHISGHSHTPLHARSSPAVQSRDRREQGWRLHWACQDDHSCTAVWHVCVSSW